MRLKNRNINKDNILLVLTHIKEQRTNALRPNIDPVGFILLDKP